MFYVSLNFKVGVLLSLERELQNVYKSMIIERHIAVSFSLCLQVFLSYK